AVGRAARRVTASVLGARGYEIRRIPAPETGPVPDPRTVDDFARAREIDHNVPDGVALLIRYHSMDAAAVAPLMDARDREYTARYFDVFTRYDHGKKTPFHRRRCASTRTGTSS